MNMAGRRIEQPGLRLRLSGESRRISSQHRQLDVLYALVVQALEGGSLEAVRKALERFRDAWEAHTSLEDGFYFPALRGLRPALARPLEVFSAEHGHFRDAFGRLEGSLAAADLPGLGASLEGLAAEIADHEAREEALLAELTGAAAQ